jgi:hypothetical protein
MQDPELVNQLKERLPEALFEKLNGSLSIDRDRLRFAEYKVRVLEDCVWYESRSTGLAAKNSPTHNWSSWNWSRESVALK